MTAPSTLAVTAVYNAQAIVALAVALSDDPTVVFTIERDGGAGSVVARDAPSFAERWRVPGVDLESPYQRLAVAPDGSRIAIPTERGPYPGVDLFDRRDGGRMWVPLSNARRADELRWTPDGALLLVSDGPDVVHVLDVARREVVDVVAGLRAGALSADGVRCARWHDDADGRWLVLSERVGGREIARWAVDAAAGSPAPHVTLACDGGAAWCTFPAEGGFELRRYAPGEAVRRVVLLEDVAATFAEPRSATIVTRAGRVAEAAVTDGVAIALAWRAEELDAHVASAFAAPSVTHNASFAAARHDGVPTLLQRSGGRLCFPDDGHVGSVRFVRASPDGSKVAAFWPTGVVTLLDATTLRPEATFELGLGPVACAFSPDGREVHALLGDGLVTLSLGDGAVRRVATFTEAIAQWGDDGFALSPDGRHAVALARTKATGRDAVLRLDLATGASESLACDAHDAIRCPRFLPGGSHLRVITQNGTSPAAWGAAVLDLQSGRWLEPRALADASRGASFEAATWTRPSLTPNGAAAVFESTQYVRLLRWDLDGGEVSTSGGPGELVALDDTRVGWFAYDSVLVLDLATLSIVALMTDCDSDDVATGCFTADGALILGLDDGRVVRLEPSPAAIV